MKMPWTTSILLLVVALVGCGGGGSGQSGSHGNASSGGGSGGHGGVGGVGGTGGTSVSSSSSGTGGVGGTGGAASSSGTGGVGGASVSSSSSSSSGASVSSSSSSGGSLCNPMGGLGCAGCLSNACCAELDACYADGACRACMTTDRNDPDCAALPLYSALDACVSTSCDAECTSCGGVIAGNCGHCMQGNCCAEVNACKGDPACMACVTFPGGPGCAGHAAAQAVLACASASCGADCYSAPAGAGCDAPAIAPSGGACVALGGDVACNPVTNAGCSAVIGEACDGDINGFHCYPPPNDRMMCQACSVGERCGPGMTCVDPGICVRHCCSDTDCGTGSCNKNKVPIGKGAVGICEGGAAPAPPPDVQHCAWVEGDACNDCCKSAYAGGWQVLLQTTLACACGGCAAACGSECGAGDVSQLSQACSACIAGSVATGTCSFAACRGDASCVAFGQCSMTCD